METQYISLNMTPSGVNPIFHISQYDVGRLLGFYVYNGSEVVDLDDYTCTVEATRTDGTQITTNVITNNNSGIFAVTATMSNVADKYNCQLVIVDGNANRVASLPFIMDVVTAALNGNDSSIYDDRSLYQQYNASMQAALANEANNRINADNLEKATRQSAVNTLQNNINAEATARANAITAEASTRASADSNLQSQINQIIAPSGEAPSAAEVQNARIGADGVTYSTLGDAIRGNDNILRNAINGTENIILTPWVQGTIQDGDGVAVDASDVIRSGQYVRLPLNGKYYFNCNNGFKLAVLSYSDSKQFISSSSWRNNGYILDNTSGSIGYIRIKVAYIETSAITPSVDTGTTCIFKNTNAINIEKSTKDIATNATQIAKIPSYEVKQGSWGNSGNQHVVLVGFFKPIAKRIKCHITRPLTDVGNYYKIGICEYSDNPYGSMRKTPSNRIDVDYGFLTDHVFELNNTTVAVAFQIAEFNSSNQAVTLSAASFDGYFIWVEDCGYIDLLNRLDYVAEDGLPAYWIDYLEQKASSINSAVADDVGFRGSAFYFMTDIHWNGNEKYSPAIIRWLRNRTPVKHIIQGGDILDIHSTRIAAISVLENYLVSLKGLPVVNLIGNHDNNSNGQSGETTRFVGEGAFYRLLNSETEAYVTWIDGKNYGYQDLVGQKIRYYFLDTGTPDLAPIDADQKAWFENSIDSMTSDWSVIIFGHMFYTPRTDAYDSLVMNTNGWYVTDVLKDTIAKENHPHIIAMICGHTHRDYSAYEPYASKFPIICSTCDAGARSVGSDPNTQYAAGTVTAQAIDIFCVNTTNKTINAIRIGNGSDRSWTYSN